MKRIIIFMMVFMLMSSFIVYGQSDAGKETRNVVYGDKNQNITIVWTDLNSDQIRVESVLANQKAGQTDEMIDIVRGSKDVDGEPIAAINGSFFSAYTDLQPQGTLVVDGNLRHISNSGSLITVNENNDFLTSDVYVKIVGGTKGQWEWPNNWYAWNINHWYGLNESVMLFDKYYDGPKPEHDFTAIAVDKKKVISIKVGSFDIPDEGFLLLTKDINMISKFTIGEEADYKIEYYENDIPNGTYKTTPLDFDSIRTAVSAGPTLVRNGIKVVDPVSEGFTEEKIYLNPSTRSLIGVDKNGRLGMAVVQNVTVYELADIAVSVGMVEAFNLDGGASSGLVYMDNYLFKPGRDLSNVIVIKKLYTKPTTIELNGRTLFFDTEPYLDTTYNRTLVPLRGIAEALGATVGWEQSTQSITIERYGTVLKLKKDSNLVMVNGEEKTMDIPVIVRDSRSYVPVRFVTEFLGGEVGWIQESKTVTLSIGEVNDFLTKAEQALSKGDQELALSEYLKVLDVDPSQMTALKAIGKLYQDMGDFENSVLYYERILEYNPEDLITIHSLAWYYYSNIRFNDSIRIFNMYVEAFPESYEGYYGLGANYSHYQVGDVTNAKINYQKAIELGLTGAGLEIAEKYLSTYY